MQLKTIAHTLCGTIARFQSCATLCLFKTAHKDTSSSPNLANLPSVAHPLAPDKVIIAPLPTEGAQRTQPGPNVFPQGDGSTVLPGAFDDFMGGILPATGYPATLLDSHANIPQISEMPDKSGKKTRGSLHSITIVVKLLLNEVLLHSKRAMCFFFATASEAFVTLVFFQWYSEVASSKMQFIWPRCSWRLSRRPGRIFVVDSSTPFRLPFFLEKSYPMAEYANQGARDIVLSTG